MLLKSIIVISLHCVVNISGMRIPDSIYITTTAAPESELKTDLTAPEYTSFSEFYQHQPNDEPQSRFLTPFFFDGQLIPVMVEHHDESTEANSSEESNNDDDGNTYKLYRPSVHENPQFIDMEPPAENQDEPDYYTEKPRKMKKYSKAQEESKKDKKVVKKAASEEDKEEEVNDEKSEKVENEEQQQPQQNADDDYSVEESAPASRLDFQLHGHKGAETYKFGYDTGRGQFRIEEKDENGDVFGKYGYYDDKGKQRVVKYSSKKNEGFKVL